MDVNSLLDPSTSTARHVIEHVQSWAIKEKLLAWEKTFTVSLHDDDLGREISYAYGSFDEAHEEHEDLADEIVESMQLVGTPKLEVVHGFQHGSRIGIDFAIIEWARQHLPTISGVYWDDIYDPGGLSAPRAGMFDLSNVTLTLDDLCPDDEESLGGIGKARLVNVQCTDPVLSHGRRP